MKDCLRLENGIGKWDKIPTGGVPLHHTCKCSHISVRYVFRLSSTMNRHKLVEQVTHKSQWLLIVH